MSMQAETTLLPHVTQAPDRGPIADAVAEGLASTPKWLPAWLFYDAVGSGLFEQITTLPEYYLTRTERAIFSDHAAGIIRATLDIHVHATGTTAGKKLRMLELGAGSASKTGILLAAAVQRQGTTQYLPVDVSEAAMDEACESIGRVLRDVEIRPQIANYVTDPLVMPKHDGPTLSLYIGSSIGNFAPEEAIAILKNLRAQLKPGDSLLLGTDLVKDTETLLAAYNDQSGVTAAFNLNMLQHINRALEADFDLSRFRHQAIWNQQESRIEMHLQSTAEQYVQIPAINMQIHFNAGETIHTENSHKFTEQSIASLLHAAGFVPVQTWHDERKWFAVTLADVTSSNA
ncbi:MAG: L-histidine N(alpha)-methyltransferase [Janthinobacterium lividum]